MSSDMTFRSIPHSNKREWRRLGGKYYGTVDSGGSRAHPEIPDNVGPRNKPFSKSTCYRMISPMEPHIILIVSVCSLVVWAF